MSWNRSIRQTHRALAVVFTVAVLVNIVLNVLPRVSEDVATWVGMVTLLPLGLLLVTGLYLFALPYATRKNSRGRTDR